VPALNNALPPAIRIVRAGYAPAAFHARFSARGKTYRYRIWNDRVLPPLEFGRAWHVEAPLDVAALKAEARAFLGGHNFAAFAANRGRPQPDTIRTIESLTIRRRGRCITVEITGDGFLYKMVRMMVGALVQHGRGKTAAGAIRARLLHPERTPSSDRVVAPAAGLYLVRVRY
jgi:tRNA pseudouridine38-40 synthase